MNDAEQLEAVEQLVPAAQFPLRNSYIRALLFAHRTTPTLFFLTYYRHLYLS